MDRLLSLPLTQIQKELMKSMVEAGDILLDSLWFIDSDAMLLQVVLSLLADKNKLGTETTVRASLAVEENDVNTVMERKHALDRLLSLPLTLIQKELMKSMVKSGEILLDSLWFIESDDMLLQVILRLLPATNGVIADAWYVENNIPVEVNIQPTPSRQSSLFGHLLRKRALVPVNATPI